MVMKKSNNKRPFFVSPMFKRKAETIQGKLLTNGVKKSLPDITELIANTKSFDNVEYEILNGLDVDENTLDVRIKFDPKKLLR
jgi:hypothetical protein